MEPWILKAQHPYPARPAWTVDAETGCWPWGGSIDKDGYGVYTVPGDRTRRAHRVVFEMAGGVIPDGLVTDHLCRRRDCVRPDHLEMVTSRENTLRGTAPSAINATKTHCVNGHALTGDNVYIRRSKDRECRACINERARRYRAIRRARKALAHA